MNQAATFGAQQGNNAAAMGMGFVPPQFGNNAQGTGAAPNTPPMGNPNMDPNMIAAYMQQMAAAGNMGMPMVQQPQQPVIYAGGNDDDDEDVNLTKLQIGLIVGGCILGGAVIGVCAKNAYDKWKFDGSAKKFA